MPSPFHQKYASQSHKYFAGKYDTDPPESPTKDAERRGSDASSTGTPISATGRRMSWVPQFHNLEAMKRPTDEESVRKRQGYTDAAIGSPGIFGQWWNDFTRGPMSIEPPSPQKSTKDVPDIKS